MEWCISPCGKYRIESLTPQTFQGAMKVLEVAYVHEEYINLALELNKHPEAIKEFLFYNTIIVLDGISVVAVEIETGEVASICFNKLHTGDILTKYNEYLEAAADIHPVTMSSIESAIEMGKMVDIAKIYNADCCFELLYLATLKHHRGKKLGYLCCKASIDVAKKLKEGPVSKITLQDLGPNYSKLESWVEEITTLVPKVCQITCTSIATQKIAKALNFTPHLRVSFTEFSHKGLNYAERNGFDPYCEVSALQL